MHAGLVAPHQRPCPSLPRSSHRTFLGDLLRSSVAGAALPLALAPSELLAVESITPTNISVLRR
jgi:hypothetical protein